MNYIFFDDNFRQHLLPLTYTRPISDLRLGILTIGEKWAKHLNASFSNITEDYLKQKFPINIEGDNLLINSRLIPSTQLIERITGLKTNEILTSNNMVLAARLTQNDVLEYMETKKWKGQEIVYDFSFDFLKNTFDIFKKNEKEIAADFQLLTENRVSEKISKTNNIAGAENIFVEKGARIEFATINTTLGKVYIGKNAEIMEGALIRGSFALCEGSTIKMGAKIYGPTTIGPFSKAGGEINNVVIQGYTNKGHDGFLGNSVLGEWCNIGADSNNSNLKNNYAEVRLWNYNTNNFAPTGLQFCGLIMGDHSKCGINTMFNTGTVIGVSSNIFGTGFPRNFVPSFAWGGASGFIEYNFKKAIEVAALVMERRNLEFNAVDEAILKAVFNISAQYRRF